MLFRSIREKRFDMKIIQVVGHSGSGKTTFIGKLAPEMNKRGRVAIQIKRGLQKTVGIVVIKLVCSQLKVEHLFIRKLL